MLRIKAFQGLIPAPQHAAEVACVPYDVVDAREAAALAEGNPRSLLHVDRAEIDLPADTDPHSDAVYQKARENFLRLQEDGSLVREKLPSLYLYRQCMGAHEQTGIGEERGTGAEFWFPLALLALCCAVAETICAERFSRAK